MKPNQPPRAGDHSKPRPGQSGKKTGQKAPPLHNARGPVEARPSDKPRFMLLKNLPPSITEDQVRALLIDARTIEDIRLCHNSKNVYIRFGDAQELRHIVAENERTPLHFNAKVVRMSIVNKIPLDMNSGSRIVLVTMYYETAPINVHVVHEIARRYGNVLRVAIYRKKSYQALIEFGSEREAADFAAACDGRYQANGLFTKVQFTQKHELVVSFNTHLEHDFTKNADPKTGKVYQTLKRGSGDAEGGDRRRKPGTGAPAEGQTAARQFGLNRTQTDLTPAPPAKPQFPKSSFRELESRSDSCQSLPHSSGGSKASFKVDSHDDAPRPVGAKARATPQRGLPHRPSINNPCPHPRQGDPRSSAVRNPHEYKNQKRSGASHLSQGLDSPSDNISGAWRSNDSGEPRSVTPSHSSVSDTRPSTVFAIRVSNLPQDMSHKQVFNLFSLYGNIERVLIDASHHLAFVFYSVESEQLTSFSHLNRLPVFETPLALCLVNQWVDEMDAVSVAAIVYKKSEHFSPEKYAERAKSITPPYSALYVFNLTMAADLELLQELFEQLRPVLQIEYLNETKNSCLVYFETVEAAATVLCTFKNISMLSKGLKINFANEQKALSRQKLGKRPARLALASDSSLGEPQRRDLPRLGPAPDADEDVDWLYEIQDKVDVSDQVKRTTIEHASAKRRFSKLSTASGDKLA